MRRLPLVSLLLAFSLQPAFAKKGVSLADSDQISAVSVIKEINLARENPTLYAKFVADSGQFHMIERGRAVDEAVRFLRNARPLPPVILSAGMCRAAADHCAEQIGGQVGHFGSDRSSPGNRINRYGRWIGTCGENLSYGQKSARAIILTLIIDDGVRSRGHRKNIFNPSFNFAGAAVGRHPRYQTVCSIDFAGGYAERGEVSSLVARNY